MKLMKITLVGIGQIFLQQNGWSGLLIAIAMFFSHWALAVACFCGSLIGALTAQRLNYDEQAIKQGLYGFNASLTLMCVIFTFGLTTPFNLLIWLWGCVSAVLATLIMHKFRQWNKTAFTFPFVFTCWLCCWAVAEFHLFGLSQTTPHLLDNTNTIHSLESPFYAWAEVNFGSNIITGILLFIAIALSSPLAAMYGMAATILGTTLSVFLFDVDSNTLANGIYGFSAILVACTFAGTAFLDFLYILFGVLFAVVIQYAVNYLGIAPYTIGFIVASWLIRRLKRWLDARGLRLKRWSTWLNP